MENLYLVTYDVSNPDSNKKLKRIISGINPQPNDLYLDKRWSVELSNTTFLVWCELFELIKVLGQVNKTDFTKLCVLEIPYKPLLTSEIIPDNHPVKDFLSKFHTDKRKF